MKSKFKNSFERVEDMRKLINAEENMYCLNGDTIQIEGITFGGCDSWYNDGYYRPNFTKILSINPINKMWNEYMNDANYIYGIIKYDDIWEIEKPKIEATYEKCDVMITHINPSCKNRHINIRFQNNPSNTFFSFEGEEYRVNGNMKFWIFGHTHEELEYEEHGVNCLCNPLGYPGENGNGQWVEMKSFEI